MGDIGPGVRPLGQAVESLHSRLSSGLWARSPHQGQGPPLRPLQARWNSEASGENGGSLSPPRPESRWPGEQCCWLQCCSKGWNRAGGAQGRGSGGKWKCGSRCQSRCRRRCHEPHNPGRLPPGGEGRARTGVGIRQCLPGTHCPSSAWSPRIHSGGIRRLPPSGLRSPYTLPGPIRTCLPPLPPSSAGRRRGTDCPGQCCSGKIFQGCRAASAWCLHSAHISCPPTRWGESRQCLDPAAHPLRKKGLGWRPNTEWGGLGDLSVTDTAMDFLHDG